LASLLIAIICQSLVPRQDIQGRIPAVEIMLANPAVRNLIREGKIHQLPNTIRTNSSIGMQLLDQDLARLYKNGLISIKNVYSYCNDREEIDQIIDSLDNKIDALLF
jgi:twitching motility protein PilT